jgi:DENN domain-containing protein 4
MVGSDVYVCYKKSPSMSKVLAYKPRILDCFPKVENLSLAQNVPMFCLPMGAVLESWSRKCGPPEMLFSTCVLTDEVY